MSRGSNPADMRSVAWLGGFESRAFSQREAMKCTPQELNFYETAWLQTDTSLQGGDGHEE